jgi:transcriptional regulator with XRE-family HTH domain
MEQDIPGRLKEARKRLNLNQIQIALDLDIQQKSISDIENGKIQNIPNKYIYYFYTKGISLEWIFDGKGVMIINGADENKNISEATGTYDLFSEQKQNEEILEESKSTTTVPNFSEKPDIRMFERLIESKEYSIKSLLAYIKSLENNIDFLKILLNKSLINKILNEK